MKALFSLFPIILAVLVNGCASSGSSSETSPATLNLQLGVSYMQQGNFDVALEKLKKALEYNDKLPEAHNAIALLYEMTGENALAEQHYQRALGLDSSYTQAKLEYGRYLCAHGKPAEGENQFLAVAANPELAKFRETAYTGAGSCARLAHDPARAEGYLRKALEQNPNSSGALLEMARLSHAQGKDLPARAFLQRYHKQAGYDPASLLLGIEIEDALGGSDLRREYARVLLTQFGNSSEARQLKPQ